MGSSTALSGCHAAIHPQRQVQLTHDFVIAETEVTQRSFRELLGYNPSTFADCGDGCPVDSVSWHEAAAYCNALSVQQGLTACYRCEGSADSVRCSPAEGVSDLAVHSCPGFRLPTEAEWEHAARAGSTSAYPNGDPATCDDLSKMAEQVAWFVDNAAGTVHEVRGKLPNARGLYDTSGNVEEWTDDWFHEAAEFDAVDPVAGAGFGHSKVLRGGSHNSRAEQARNSSRSQQATEARSSEIGFRCLRSVP